MKLFVGGLPYDMEDQEFREIFEAYGKVSSATVVLDKETRKSRGFGFVDYYDPADAEKVIDALDGGTLEGRRLTVKTAIDKPRPAVDKTRTRTGKQRRHIDERRSRTDSGFNG